MGNLVPALFFYMIKITVVSKLLIVDEVSERDIRLYLALLKGLRNQLTHQIHFRGGLSCLDMPFRS